MTFFDVIVLKGKDKGMMDLYSALDDKYLVLKALRHGSHADLGSCTDCQQGGLLQLGSRRYSRPATGPAAVRLECRRPFGLLSEAVRTHNPIAS